MGGTLTIIFVLGLIWAISCMLSILSALYLYSLLSGLEIYYSDISFYSFYGLFLNKSFIIVSAVIGVVSGLCAMVCCAYIYKLENHQRACMLCLVGSILAILSGGPAGVVGI
ncbi:MAG: hypothetical protein LBB30_05200 [Candidatus Methanoplasma sp.]|jgi:hypothetical protein|nr:hypothetical protein [Candidatus Methanoplasma sp.]